MKIPPELKIGGITYPVTFHKEQMINDEGNKLVARIQYVEPEIQIYDKLGDQMVDISFLHEVFHGIFYCMGIVGEPEVTLTERFVEQCSHIWYQVLQQIIEFNKN